MTTPSDTPKQTYKQWQPDAQDPATDPLAKQVNDREDEDVQRDPEAGIEPPSIALTPDEDPGIVPVDPPAAMVEGRHR